MLPADGSPGRTSLNAALEEIARYYRENHPGARPLRLKILVQYGDQVEEDSVRFPEPLLAERYWHSEDYGHVRFEGLEGRFSTSQAKAIRKLWPTESGIFPEIHFQTLLTAAGSQADRLADLFSRHDWWKMGLIAQGVKEGYYRLYPREQAEPREKRGPRGRPGAPGDTVDMDTSATLEDELPSERSGHCHRNGDRV